MVRIFLLILAELAAGGAASAQQRPKLDTTSFVVVGEGLAAGLADFSLREVYQKNSFPALLARQFGTAFMQPLVEAPGMGGVPGYPQPPQSSPAPLQTTVRSLFPPSVLVFNVAVPGHRLVDALHLRPQWPLSQPDPKQTVTNFILGIPSLLLDTEKPRWSQVEYAARMNPTLALVELGYVEALEAAVAANPGLLPSSSAFRTDYRRALAALRENYAEVIAMTIPDPFDTAYFSGLAAAADLSKVPAATMVSKYGLRDTDLLSPAALMAIGAGQAQLPAGSVIAASAAAEIRGRIRQLNDEITASAKEAGAVVYDLNGLFARIRVSGLTAGSYRLTAGYLGGFYSLSGSYPGMTGHAVIANDVLAFLNQTYGTSYSTLDVARTAAADPAVRFRPVVPPGGASR